MSPPRKRKRRPAVGLTCYWPPDPTHRFQLGALWPRDDCSPGALSGRFADRFPGKITVTHLILSNGKTLPVEEVALSGVNRLRRRYLIEHVDSLPPELAEPARAYAAKYPWRKKKR